MDNLHRASGNVSPFRRAVKKFGNLGLFGDWDVRWEGEDETFTAAQVEEKMNAAVAEAKKGGGKFFDNFAPELKDHPSITKFENNEGMAKSYVELEKKIGMKGIILPGEGADEGTILAFHKALGVPEKPEGFALQKIEGLHEKAVSEEASTKLFQEAAHKLGFTPAQFNGIREVYLKDVSAKLTAWDEQQTKDKQETETNLRSEWGGQYESKVLLAHKVIKAYGGDEALDRLAEGGGNDPVLIKLFATIGEHLSEDALGKIGGSNLGMTKAEAQTKINEMRADDKSAFNDANNPGHTQAVEYMQSLYKIRDGAQ